MPYLKLTLRMLIMRPGPCQAGHPSNRDVAGSRSSREQLQSRLSYHSHLQSKFDVQCPASITVVVAYQIRCTSIKYGKNGAPGAFCNCTLQREQ